jgi:hypothetical protein
VYGEVTKGLETFWMNLQIEFCINQNVGLWKKISYWQNMDKKSERFPKCMMIAGARK